MPGVRERRWLRGDATAATRGALVGAAFALVVTLGWVRVATEALFAFSLLLLVPAAAVAWFVGGGWGGAIAALSVGVWLWADLRAGTAPEHAVVNALVRGLVFGLAVFVLSTLRRAQRALRDLAFFDPLTGLPNRRFLALMLERERRRARRSREPITLLYLDLDDFKPVNDRHGHAAGDRVLAEIATALGAVLRSSDFASRIGGDEFAVVLAGCGTEQARTVVEKLRKGWERMAAWREHGVGVSIGAATFAAVPGSSDAMLAQADSLLYEAKKGGKGVTSYRLMETADCAPSRT